MYTYISCVNNYPLFKRRIDDYTLKIYLLCNNIYVSFIYHIDLFLKASTSVGYFRFLFLFFRIIERMPRKWYKFFLSSVYLCEFQSRKGICAKIKILHTGISILKGCFRKSVHFRMCFVMYFWNSWMCMCVCVR